MRRLSLILLMLGLTSASLASRTFGLRSWDGNPPGTLEQLYGSGFVFGSKVFPAGKWTVKVRETHTAWMNNQLIVQPLGLLMNSQLTFTSDVPWSVDAITRDFPSGNAKFAYKETIIDGVGGVWLIGLEDMLTGDDDYQDAVITVQRVN